jgi:hypothetical protein
MNPRDLSKSSALVCALLAACGGSRVVDAPEVPGACHSDFECAPGICNVASGKCEAASCNPACSPWQTCAGRSCVLSAGRCDTNADCSAALPICDTNHTCVAPALSTPATLPYAALVITSRAYAGDFQELAQLHTLTGVPTQLITVEDICAATPGGCNAADACHDAPKAIKDYLIAQQQRGLRQVVLGGDGRIVPSRQTHDTFANAILGYSYSETFFSDYYFADLSQWDTNGDCVYGDPATDHPAYVPNLGVTRISFSSPAELQTYLAKAQAYLTAYDTSRVNTALLLSNVATEVTLPVINKTLPIDAGFYFETPGRTRSLVPGWFDTTRLYSSLAWPGAGQLTNPAEQAAFEQGYNIVVHAGHGGEGYLTVEQNGGNAFTGSMAHQLKNKQYPLMFSCACDAATFADGPFSAGQQFLTAPAGGGIGYLGNSTLGLGLGGGVQLIDALLRFAFAHSNPLVGEAVLAGHANLPTSDSITINNVPLLGSVSLSVIDAASWRWTQKAATYLGDGLLPVYTTSLSAAPAFSVRRAAIGNFSQIAFTPSTSARGTLAVAIGSSVYELPLNGSRAEVSLTVAGAPTRLNYGFSSSSTLAAYQQIALP